VDGIWFITLINTRLFTRLSNGVNPGVGVYITATITTS